LIEVFMPPSQKLASVGNDQLLYLSQLSRSVARPPNAQDWLQAVHGLGTGRLNVNVGRRVIPGIEVETVGSDPKERGHADLVKGSAGVHHRQVHSSAAYLCN
jgi:hypothetical protein